MFCLESFIILPFILIYIDILIQIDNYIDMQIEMITFANEIKNKLDNIFKERNFKLCKNV